MNLQVLIISPIFTYSGILGHHSHFTHFWPCCFWKSYA